MGHPEEGGLDAVSKFKKKKRKTNKTYAVLLPVVLDPVVLGLLVGWEVGLEVGLEGADVGDPALC